MADYMTFSTHTFVDAQDTVKNFARVVCLLMEKGTECLKNIMMEHLPNGCQSLEEAIDKHRNDLLALKDKVLGPQQLIILGLNAPRGSPVVCSVNSAAIDMSLWYTLIRNASTLKIHNWDTLQKKTLKPTHRAKCHDIIRLQRIRNFMVHLPYPKLEQTEFEQTWTELKTVLGRRGIEESVINEYMMRQTFDPDQTMTYLVSLQRQTHRDLKGYYQLELHKKRLIMIVSAVVIATVVVTAIIVCWFVITFSRTWSSCINDMAFPHSTNTPAISYMPRNGWRAQEALKMNPKLKPSLDYAIISSTQATGRCETTDDCCSTMRRVQKIAFSVGDDDIMFNYLIGQDGVVFEGRGTIQSAGARRWNDKAITIGFLGTFFNNAPNDDSIFTAKMYLQYLVDNNVLSKNFTLYGLCQVRNFPDAPGCSFYRNLKTWNATAPGSSWSWREREGSFCGCD